MSKRIDPIAKDVVTATFSTTKWIKVSPPSTAIFPNLSAAAAEGPSSSSSPTRGGDGSSVGDGPFGVILPKLDGDNKYNNVQPGWHVPGPTTIIKWRLCPGGLPTPAFPKGEELRRKLPSVAAVDDHAISRFSPFYAQDKKSGDGGKKNPHCCDPDQLVATWMSHASFIVTAGGYTVLTDPVWSHRVSPVQFAGPARMLPPPIPLEAIPYIDVVSISHNHYDHLDTACVKHLIKSNHKLAAQRGGGGNGSNGAPITSHPIFVVPMGMKKRWFEPLAAEVPELDLNRVVELMWWDTADVTAAVAENRRQIAAPSSAPLTPLPPFTVTAVPVQHWTQRGAMDRNMELWCGFVYAIGGSNATAAAPAAPTAVGSLGTEPTTAAVDNNSTPSSLSSPFTTPFKFFHCGDTGYYKPIFKQIGDLCGPFDFAMIPIGAYEPRFVMQNQHIDPFQAVQIHDDIKALHSAGMHWGTFVLTDEPVDEPPKALAVGMAELFKKAVMPKGTSSSPADADVDVDDANAEKLRILRAQNFTVSAVAATTSSPSGGDGGAATALTLSTGPSGDAIPYFDCERPFRALKHGESWVISGRGDGQQ